MFGDTHAYRRQPYRKSRSPAPPLPVQGGPQPVARAKRRRLSLHASVECCAPGL